jgi:hypothetical protein
MSSLLSMASPFVEGRLDIVGVVRWAGGNNIM